MGSVIGASLSKPLSSVECGAEVSVLLGQAKRSLSHLGGANTGSLVRRGCAIVFGTSQLCNSFWYVAVAQ